MKWWTIKQWRQSTRGGTVLHPKTFTVLQLTFICNNYIHPSSYMSASGEPPLEDDSSRDEQTQRNDPGGTRPPNIIEFVNSQDPNVRSAIQRHTAYHSAAQRRDARSRLLRRSSQSRYLEWGRRPPRGDADTTTASSASSASISPAPSTERPRQDRTSSNLTDQESETSQSRSASITEMEASVPSSKSIPEDDAILQFCKYYAGIKKSPYCTKPEPNSNAHKPVC